MLTMMGTLMSARSMAALNRFTPTGTWKTAMMTGLITLRPMKPQTTLGMAASSSITIFNVSFVLPVQNSETKIAAPNPKGTAITIASVVTLRVPTMSAPMPYWGWTEEVGIQFLLKKNSLKSSFARKGAPSLKTKKKMPNTNTMALMPQR